MKSKRFCLSSQFPASIDDVWAKLQRFDTLQYVAAPYAFFHPVDHNTEMKWIEGEIFRFQLRLFGMIPMGIHTIKVIQFDKHALTIYTNENNKCATVWNHKIILKKNDAGCIYTDEIEIDAEWKTPIVFLWSYLFYRHRQRKWLKLLYAKQ